MNKKTIIYARVSTKDQSPEMQIRQLKDYADRAGFKVSKVYQEKVSATKANRPEFIKLMDDVRKHRTDTVLVWKLDRLARSTVELLKLLQEFKDLDVELISYTENISGNSAIGKALVAVLAIFAEFENDVRSERIKAGLENAKAKGKQLGRPPLSSQAIDEIRAMKKNGATIASIMRKTGLAKNTVKKYIH